MKKDRSDKVYNLMWIIPRSYNEIGSEQFHQPIPDETLENIVNIAQKNQKADVQLWIDSRRLTDAQMQWLSKMVQDDSPDNLSLANLWNLPQYRENPLYQQPDTNPYWRHDKNSLIWRQVDAARILVCLESDYDQVFYSDADVINLVLDSDEVQNKIKKHGIILAGAVNERSGYPWYENGLFGFDARKRGFFRALYDRTLQDVAMKRENGYGSYIHLINSELKGREGIDTREIVFQARFDKTEARHPGLIGRDVALELACSTLDNIKEQKLSKQKKHSQNGGNTDFPYNNLFTIISYMKG